MKDSNCLFCKIIDGDIPSYKIYEDEYTYAFLDIAKDIDGHTVVVPKNHYKNIFDINEEELIHLINSVQKIANHYVNDCGFDGVNIINNNNEAAGQSVNHIHFHILPRLKNDGNDFFSALKGAKNELEKMHDFLKM